MGLFLCNLEGLLPEEKIMKLKSLKNGVVMLTLGVAFLVGGCGKEEDKQGAENKPKQEGQSTGKDQDKKGHDHSDWWCKEHGIPEHLCSMCNDKVAAECKKKGDWCKEHDRAKSQCFKCDPKLKEKFAAMYRARYGKEPPPIEEETKGDEPKKAGK